MIAFFICLGFNAYWYYQDGQNFVVFKRRYSYAQNGWLAILTWAWVAFCISCLIW